MAGEHERSSCPTKSILERRPPANIARRWQTFNFTLTSLNVKGVLERTGEYCSLNRKLNILG